MIPIAWTIAGSDSGGGAGLQADLKTFSAFGVHGCSVITGLTAQNTSRIDSVEATSLGMLDAQLAVLREDLRPSAIKTGMLGTPEVASVVARAIESLPASYVCDPVITSSSGTELLSARARGVCESRIFPLARLVTPNAIEASILSGVPLDGPGAFESAARYFLGLGAKAVMLKGGHVAGSLARDFFTDGTLSFWLTSPRHERHRTHGTGCTLSAAIAAGLALGWDLGDSVVAAKAYVSRGLRLSDEMPSGIALLRHAPWPVDAVDFPRLTDGPEAAPIAFPPVDGEIGFYPIVPRAEWIERLAAAGARTFQLRVKDLAGRELEREIVAADRAARRVGARLFVNDHWELALKHGCYGVHLGQEDMRAADIAGLARAGLRLGLSTHTLAELARALAHGPSYVALGPIFPTRLKVMRHPPQGIERVTLWRRLSPCPVVGIGGLTPESGRLVREAGADGAAVITDLFTAADPVARARRWAAALD